jgi:hypothetical protein
MFSSNTFIAELSVPRIRSQINEKRIFNLKKDFCAKCRIKLINNWYYFMNTRIIIEYPMIFPAYHHVMRKRAVTPTSDCSFSFVKLGTI